MVRTKEAFIHTIEQRKLAKKWFWFSLQFVLISRQLGDFWVSGRAGTYSSYQVKPTTCLKSFHFLCTYPRKVFSAWIEVSAITFPPSASITVTGVKNVGNFWDLGGPVIYSSYHMRPITWIKLCRHLGAYTKEVSSAWAEVCTSTCTIMAPVGRF
jgi:hypothetical protein